MKNLIYFLLLFTFHSYGQQKKVSVYSIQNGENPEIYAKNNTKVTQKVTLQLKTKGFKKHDNEIVKNVSPKDSLLMITLIPTSSNSDMQVAYGSEPNPTEEEKKVKADILTKNTYKKGVNLSKGIVVFHKNDCPRCNRATSYLLDNNIDFTWVQIPTNQQVLSNTAPKELVDNQLMLQEKLKKKRITGSYTTPVFMVDGKITHSHRDLNKFLSKLK